LPFVRRMNPSIPAGLAVEEEIPEEDLPSFGTCLLIVLIPVILMAGSAIGELSMAESNPVLPYLQFFGEGPIALLVALLAAIYLLGPTVAKVAAHQRATAAGKAETADQPATLVSVASESSTGSTGPAAPTGSRSSAVTPSPGSTTGPKPSRFDAVSRSCVEAVKPMAIIILIIGAGGAFKQVLVDSGMADYVKDLTSGWDISPIILAWAIAVVLRISLGSATVAVVTAAGVALPLTQSSGVSPELMVLAVSCGSIACSHVNDPGFWLFKEYFNLSVIEAIKARTTYTSALSVLGLGGVLIMNTIVG
jgi:Gnt-I system high-affinity gluconate transporter